MTLGHRGIGSAFGKSRRTGLEAILLGALMISASTLVYWPYSTFAAEVESPDGSVWGLNITRVTENPDGSWDISGTAFAQLNPGAQITRAFYSINDGLETDLPLDQTGLPTSDSFDDTFEIASLSASAGDFVCVGLNGTAPDFNGTALDCWELGSESNIANGTANVENTNCTIDWTFLNGTVESMSYDSEMMTLTAILGNTVDDGNLQLNIAKAIVIGPFVAFLDGTEIETHPIDETEEDTAIGFPTTAGSQILEVIGTENGNCSIDDTIPPDTSIIRATDGDGNEIPDGGETVSQSITIEFSGDDGDGSGVAGFECSLDGAEVEQCNEQEFTTTNLEPGEHNFAVGAIDIFGNVDPTPAEYHWTVTTPLLCECLSLHVFPDADIQIPMRIDGGTLAPPSPHLYRVQINLEWFYGILCESSDALICEGTVVLDKSSQWIVDRDRETVLVDESFRVWDEGTPFIVCEGPCDDTEVKRDKFGTTYTATLARSDGKDITKTVEGKVKLSAHPTDCKERVGNTITLVVKADVRNGTITIDGDLSDYDGDGLSNKKERQKGTNPLDTDTDDDGSPDGEDHFPKNPDKS